MTVVFQINPNDRIKLADEDHILQYPYKTKLLFLGQRGFEKTIQ